MIMIITNTINNRWEIIINENKQMNDTKEQEKTKKRYKITMNEMKRARVRKWHRDDERYNRRIYRRGSNQSHYLLGDDEGEEGVEEKRENLLIFNCTLIFRPSLILPQTVPQEPSR